MTTKVILEVDVGCIYCDNPVENKDDLICSKCYKIKEMRESKTKRVK